MVLFLVMVVRIVHLSWSMKSSLAAQCSGSVKEGKAFQIIQDHIYSYYNELVHVTKVLLKWTLLRLSQSMHS